MIGVKLGVAVDWYIHRSVGSGFDIDIGGEVVSGVYV